MFIGPLWFGWSNTGLFQLSTSGSIDERCAPTTAATTFSALTTWRRREFDSKLFPFSVTFDECLITFSAFNVGEYRRAATDKYRNHDFFRQDNAEAQAIRQ